MNSESWQDQQNHVRFLQRKYPSRTTYFSSFRIPSIQALRKLSVGEELVVYYEYKNDFSYKG